MESVDAMETDVVVLVAESIGLIYTDVVEVVVHGIADDDDAGALYVVVRHSVGLDESPLVEKEPANSLSMVSMMSTRKKWEVSSVERAKTD